VTGALLLLVARLTVSVSPTPSPTASAFSPSVVSTRATDDNIVRPGWLGFIVFLAMAGALYFLLKSFARHLKRVNFDEEPPDPPRTRGTGTGPQSGDGAEV
jgi:hypothetical protein